MKNLEIISRMAVMNRLANGDVDGLVSVSGPEDGGPTRLPSSHRTRILHLNISDIHCGHIWPCETVEKCVAKGMRLATLEDFDILFSFADCCTGTLVIHCTAGISRSPALALALLARQDGHGREKESVQRLLHIAPVCLPNPGLVMMADQILNRNGNLMAAASEILETQTMFCP